MKPDLHETHKQHTFDSFCKKVLVHEANNGHRDINRRAAIEISMSDLPEEAMEQLAVYDDYPWEHTSFPILDNVILIKNDRLAEALEAMPETERAIILMYWFLDMADRDMKEYKEYIPSVSERNPLRRKVICGTCGFAMVLSNTKNAKYHCRTSHLETDFDCTSEGILQADIHEMVVTLIRTYAAYAVSLEHLHLLQKERIQAEKKQARRELAVLQSRKNQHEKSLQDLYEKLIDGTIDKVTYLSQKASNQAQMQELTEKMERLEKSSQTTTEQGGAFIDKYKEYTELETLNSDIANDVVKRVTVYKDGGIKIELALRDELEKLLTCLETVDVAS